MKVKIQRENMVTVQLYSSEVFYEIDILRLNPFSNETLRA